MSRILRELIRKPNPFLHAPPPLPSLTHSTLSPLHQTLLSPPFTPSTEENQQNGNAYTNTQMEKSEIYPSFSFGYFLNPVLPSGSVLSHPFMMGPHMGVGDEKELPNEKDVIWADSVKKKRKKKMNKHKYKKLRKRLRRKTKT